MGEFVTVAADGSAGLVGLVGGKQMEVGVKCTLSLKGVAEQGM